MKPEERELLKSKLEEARQELVRFHAETSVEDYANILSNSSTVTQEALKMRHEGLIRKIFEAEEALKKV